MNLRKVALLLTCLLPAGASRGQESWHVILVNGQKAGYLQNSVKPMDSDRAAREITTTSLFRMKRMGQEIELAETTVTVEDARGQITRIKKSTLMSNFETVYEGEVRDGELQFTTRTMGKEVPSSIDWPEDVPSALELERRLARTGFKPGASIQTHQFDFSMGEVFGVTVTVESDEEIELPSGPRTLHRVVEVPDLAGLPETVSWVDDDGAMVKSSTSMIGLQMETLLSDSREVSEFLERDSGATAEVFMQSTITANLRLPRPRSLTSILYRVTVKQPDGNLPALFDERQTIVSKDDEHKTALLRIDLRVPPADRRQQRPLSHGENPDPALHEYLEPNALLQSDDPMLLELSQRGVGGETDAWSAAQKLERLVYETIDKKSLDVAFASALEVCQTRQGDCSEHAVLLAALCRSAGIPSRVAMGIVYVGGIFGGHAWTEVSIDGSWYALDGTIGRGTVDPTHIRFGTTSLKGGGFSKGLLGVLQGLGMIDLEIVEFSHGELTTRVGAVPTRTVVEDGRFRDLLEGVSFGIPEGWKVEASAPEILEMSNRYVLAELTSATSPATLQVISRQVPYDYTFEDLRRQWDQRARGASVHHLPRRIAGLEGLVGSFENNGQSFRAGAVLVSDSLYVVQLAPVDEAGFEAFHELLSTLSFN